MAFNYKGIAHHEYATSGQTDKEYYHGMLQHLLDAVHQKKKRQNCMHSVSGTSIRTMHLPSQHSMCSSFWPRTTFSRSDHIPYFETKEIQKNATGFQKWSHQWKWSWIKSGFLSTPPPPNQLICWFSAIITFVKVPLLGLFSRILRLTLNAFYF